MSSVPVSLLPIPRQQFFSASGAPLAGGFIYTYVAGTSTPAPTYLDYTGTFQNTNPITLDAGGFAAIWIPAGPIDIAVFNSSMVQQYKVLSVTALPATVTSLTASFFQSASPNPALSGVIRLANTDVISWRNAGNSADLSLSLPSSGILNFGGAQFSFLNEVQTWTQDQFFSNISANTFGWKSGTGVVATLMHSDSAPRTYTFPDASGNVITDGAPGTLNFPTINSPTINGVPINSIPTDYDDYSFKVVNSSGTFRGHTIAAGAIATAAVGGSFIEIETTFYMTNFTGTAPTYGLLVNGQNVATITMSVGARYDVRCSIAQPANAGSTAVCVETNNMGVVIVEQTTLSALLDGSSPLTISESLNFTGTANMAAYFQHVRIRK